MRTSTTSTTMTTTKEKPHCLVCDVEYNDEGLSKEWAEKHKLGNKKVCPWCVHRGWPKFRVMFEALASINTMVDDDPSDTAEKALWFVVGVPPDVSSPTDQEREEATQADLERPKKVVRKVKRRPR